METYTLRIIIATTMATIMSKPFKFAMKLRNKYFLGVNELYSGFGACFFSVLGIFCTAMIFEEISLKGIQ